MFISESELLIMVLVLITIALYAKNKIDYYKEKSAFWKQNAFDLQRQINDENQNAPFV
ncbi:MAG: hypothetical protein GOVbin4580_35 [Prokaryotic dsDNA virus sp.]|nr:MAG: hypothetical protein GOVbin4580_35 [Prokaryotic dsDNA virus sp.]|tara:strand:+ start:16367 stop:16540 length:174 start_codon:yes stop_codon:yes gene_type:complete